jgi:hypothetical protein
MKKTPTRERFSGIQGVREPKIAAVGLRQAVRVREYYPDAPGGAEVWKYSFPLAPNQPVEDIHVRFNTAGNAPTPDGIQWTGVFECARGRHFDVLPWPAANAIVVAAANALYIVDPAKPERFSGFAAPVEIDDLTFDESAQHLFVADSLRIYAFSSDRLFQWMSEPLDGYGARFCGCGGRVLAVEIRHFGPEPEGSEAPPSVLRLRTEDGTILRSRFRLTHRYRYKSEAA